MNPRPSVVDVVDKLLALGSARHIALYLAAEGVTGRIGIPNACPIACYVQRETGDESVSTTGDVLFTHGADAETFLAFLDTSGTSVHRFVEAFDDGAYPELVTRELERLEGDEEDDA